MNLFIPEDLSIKFRDKGFEDKCAGYWFNGKPYLSDNGRLYDIQWSRRNHGSVLALTWDQAQEWLRKKKKIHIEILNDGGLTFSGYRTIVVDRDKRRRKPVHNGVTMVYWSNDIGMVEDYRPALVMGLDYALDIM